MAGLGGQGTTGASNVALHPISALSHLRNLLANLPATVRFRILDLNIRPDAITVDGQARTHAEAEAIAIALRQCGIYEVEAPKTQAKDPGVSFIFTAKPIQGDAANVRTSK